MGGAPLARVVAYQRRLPKRRRRRVNGLDLGSTLVSRIRVEVSFHKYCALTAFAISNNHQYPLIFLSRLYQIDCILRKAGFLSLLVAKMSPPCNGVADRRRRVFA
jgi:hypothetical protein